MSSGFHGQSNNIQNKNPADTESIENRFFTLDFEEESFEMTDVENHFFTTFPHEDPTQGDVVYDRKKWINKDMINLEKGVGLYLYIKDRNDNKMFDSFRLTSKGYYNLSRQTKKILFVFKGKLPSAKGVWPAWWLNGSDQDTWTYEASGYIETDSGLDRYSGKGHFYDTPSAVNSTDWPGGGEIDIIETINGDNIIHNTIHTCPQMCDSEWNQDGFIINCANAKNGDPNSGCSGKPYKTISPEGTFACLWERNNIKFYYWKPDANVRSSGGPLSESPEPDTWKKGTLKNEVQLLETEAECNSDLHYEWQCKSCTSNDSCVFKNLKIIFNITLCGVWAGNEFDKTDTSLKNCKEYIFSEGRDIINNQFLKIEYLSVVNL
jgi:hypothetical protein